MTRTPLTDEDLFSGLDAEQHFGTLVEASASLGMSPQPYRYRLNVAKNRLQGYQPDYGEPVQGFSTPFLPTDKMPTDELIEYMTNRYNKRRNARDARQPIPIRMSDDEPVVLMFFGDPHLDSPAMGLARIKALCGHLGVHGGHAGRFIGRADHTDNWIGRLQREYAHSEASAEQGWQLADWLIKSNDPLLIIRGNHDAWSGHGDPSEYIGGVGNLYEKWKALVVLRWPNGRTAVLDISHDHVGTSQFHPLHGQVRQARFNRSGVNADLYISVLRHTWGLMTTEMQGRVVWMCRARGFISCFAEPQEAAEFLTYKRGC